MKHIVAFLPAAKQKTVPVSARRDKEVLCINFAAPKMKTPASGLMKKFDFNGFLQAGGFASLGNQVAVFIRA